MNEEKFIIVTDVHSPGLELVAAERRRQIVDEGYTTEKDLEFNSTRDLICAAIAYLVSSCNFHNDALKCWPPGWKPMKPTTRERDLVKALALGIAALDRIKAEEARKGVKP